MSEKECKSTMDDCSEVEYVTSNFNLHKFSAVVSERKIVYQVIKMVDSILVFINDRDNMQLTNMFVALMNRYDSQPIATRLLGDFMDEVSKGVALRLSKKLNKTVYVSCNMEDDRTLLPLIEKEIYEEAKKNPNMF